MIALKDIFSKKNLHYFYLRFHVYSQWKMMKIVLISSRHGVFNLFFKFYLVRIWIDTNDLLYVIVPIRLFSNSIYVKSKRSRLVPGIVVVLPSQFFFPTIRLHVFAMSCETVLTFALDEYRRFIPSSCRAIINRFSVLRVAFLSICSLSGNVSHNRSSLERNTKEHFVSPWSFSTNRDIKARDSVLFDIVSNPVKTFPSSLEYPSLCFFFVQYYRFIDAVISICWITF